MHPQLMTLFYNLLYKKASPKKNKKLNPWCKLYLTTHLYSAFVCIRGLAFDLEIWYNNSLFCQVLLDVRGHAISLFFGEIHALIGENNRLRSPYRRIQKSRAKLISRSPSKPVRRGERSEMPMRSHKFCRNKVKYDQIRYNKRVRKTHGAAP